MLIEIIITYFVIGLLWSIYALYKQIKLYGFSWKHIVFCAILNCTIWPVALLIAIIKMYNNHFIESVYNKSVEAYEKIENEKKSS